MKKTLLETALVQKKNSGYGSYTEEELELALSLCAGKINYENARVALGSRHKGSAVHFLGRVLRNACLDGKIKIIINK